MRQRRLASESFTEDRLALARNGDGATGRGRKSSFPRCPGRAVGEREKSIKSKKKHLSPPKCRGAFPVGDKLSSRGVIEADSLRRPLPDN